MGGKVRLNEWFYFSLMAPPVRAGGRGGAFSLIRLIAAGWPSPFPLMEKDQTRAKGESNNAAEKPQQPVVNIKGFPNLPNRQAGVPWAQGDARLLSARAALSALVTVVQNQSSGSTGRNQGPFQPSGPPSDSKPGWHCRKARRYYEGFCRAVTPVSVVGNVYGRSGISASARQSLQPVNERRNHLPVVVSHITDDVSQIKPLITKSANLIADRQHTRIVQTCPNHFISNATLPVQAIDRSPVTLAKNPPWLVRCAPICLGTNFPAPGAAAAFWSFSAAGKGLGHAPAMRGSIKRQRFQEPFALGLANAGNALLTPFYQPFYHSL
ncbi:MAG TPA: hypothetical protein VGE06_05560 [Flavisolibacter sp.]